MRITLTWIALNLLRLVAVVCMVWALVAQFVALATDMKAYSKADGKPAVAGNVSFAVVGSFAASQSSSALASEDTTSSATDTPPYSSSNSPDATSILASSSTITPPYSSLSTGGAPQPKLMNAPTGTSAPTTITAPSGVSTATDLAGKIYEAEAGAEGYDMTASQSERMRPTMAVGAIDRRRAGRVRRDEGLEVAEEEYVPGTSVPDQVGGFIFVLISRIILAAGLVVLIMAQLGWPEMILYTHLPWLGPQSTPLWLGVGQVVVAVENLRVYAAKTNLLPAWGLLAIGAINGIIAAVLLFLGRRIPKSPPPPLYFNLSQRLLFWRPLPQCYVQLFEPPAEKADDDPEHGDVPMSNAMEIGLDEEDEKVDEARAHPPIARSTQQLPARSALAVEQGIIPPIQVEHDVRQGGYPTFSGGGVTDTQRQVPTGIVERGSDGRVLRFVDEEGRPVGRGRLPVIQQPVDSRGPKEPTPPPDVQRARGNTIHDDSEGLSRTLPSSTARPAQRPKGEQPGLPPRQTRPAPGQPRPTRSRSKAGRTDPLTPIDEEAVSMADDPRGSTFVATSDLGCHFPLPPSRSNRESSANDLLVGPTAQRMVTAHGSPAISPGPAPGTRASRPARPEQITGSVPLEIASQPERATPAPAPASGTSTKTESPQSLDKPKVGLQHTSSPSRTDQLKSTPKFRSDQPARPASPTVAPKPTFNPSPKAETRQSARKAKPPQPRSAPSSPESPERPKLTHANSDPSSIHTAEKVETIRSSLALASSSSSSPTTMRAARKARGVRFAPRPTSIAPTSPISPASCESSSTEVDAPSFGIRIPGTSITLRSPFSAPVTPRRRSMSLSDSSSGSDNTSGSASESESGSETETEIKSAKFGRRGTARPGSLASISSTLSDSDLRVDGGLGGGGRPGLVARESSGTLGAGVEKNKDKDKDEDKDKDGSAVGRDGVRPKSMAVLGGGYLGGANESRRYSSIDST